MKLLPILTLFAVSLMSALPAGAADDPAVKAAKAVIHHQVEAMNKGDLAAIKADWGPQGSIIDEFAPFYWQGSSAADAWWADFQKLAASMKASDFVLKVGGFKSVNVTETGAYVVASASIHLKADGKPVAESGDWSFVLSKTGGDWKIVAWSWSGAPPKPVK